MKFPPFSYARPSSVQQASRLLAEDDSARILAGGQSLLPLLAFRLVYPSRLIDLRDVPELDHISRNEHTLTIGAMVTHARNLTDPVVAQCLPILPQVVAHVAHQAVRSRGTLGGSLCHADAAAEMPALMYALQAQLHLAGPDATRTVSIEDFLLGHYTTDLQIGEILTRVDIPLTSYHWAFEEIVRRKGDFALAMALAGLRCESGRCVQARLVLAAACEKPESCEAAAQFLAGKEIDEAIAGEAAALAVRELSIRSDIHGSEALRGHLARVVMKRAILRASKGE